MSASSNLTHAQDACCVTCRWWETPDEEDETCRYTVGRAPSDHCSMYQAAKPPMCDECRWLDEPLRNKTCRFHYGRDEKSPICDGLTRTRRYTRKPVVEQVDTMHPYLRDLQTGAPFDVFVLTDGALLVKPSTDSRFGLAIVSVDQSHFRVQPVQIEHDRLAVVEMGTRRRRLAFAGSVLLADADGNAQVVGSAAATVFELHAYSPVAVTGGKKRSRARLRAAIEQLVAAHENHAADAVKEAAAHESAHKPRSGVFRAVRLPVDDSLENRALGAARALLDAGYHNVQSAAETVADRFARSMSIDDAGKKQLRKTIVDRLSVEKE